MNCSIIFLYYSTFVILFQLCLLILKCKYIHFHIYLLVFQEPGKYKKGDYYVLNFHRYTVFTNTELAKVAKVSESNDPVLVNISLNLVQNYIKSQGTNKLYSEKAPELCDYLNKWLDYMNFLYTCGGNCICKNNLWTKYIDPLWNELEKFEVSWCSRKANTYAGSFPSEWIPSSCNNIVSGNCDIGIKNPEVEAHTSSGTSNFTLAFGYVLFAITIIFILLHKFTPAVSCLHSQIRRKIKLWKNIDAEETEESLESQHQNMNSSSHKPVNLMFYHTLQN
ncbi:PIR protein [Plasmodium ovale]|uniref:PIR protein n=1 Tax=Plasmodium ovale TaxID=36330 RepID=A0A1D3JDT1_PLAOA|nr:PIR protein [Plasmodium ovale]